jgi:O-antigen/teichoic acid export membrane protein
MYVALGFTGTVGVTTLSFCFLLITSARKFTDALGHNLSPKVLAAAASGDQPRMLQLFDVLITFTFVFGGLLSAGLFFYGGDFLRIWLANESVAADLVLRVLAAGLLLLPIGGFVAFFLDGLGKYWRNAKIALVEAVAGGALMLILGATMQAPLVGVALGYVLPKACFAIVYVYLFMAEISIPLRQLVVLATRRLGFALTAYGVCGLGIRFLPVIDWPSFLMSVAAVTFAYIVIVSPMIWRLQQDVRAQKHSGFGV